MAHCSECDYYHEKSLSFLQKQAGCVASCGLEGWRPTDRMESCNTKEKQFSSLTQYHSLRPWRRASERGERSWRESEGGMQGEKGRGEREIFTYNLGLIGEAGALSSIPGFDTSAHN